VRLWQANDRRVGQCRPLNTARSVNGGGDGRRRSDARAYPGDFTALPSGARRTRRTRTQRALDNSRSEAHQSMHEDGTASALTGPIGCGVARSRACSVPADAAPQGLYRRMRSDRLVRTRVRVELARSTSGYGGGVACDGSAPQPMPPSARTSRYMFEAMGMEASPTGQVRDSSQPARPPQRTEVERTER